MYPSYILYSTTATDDTEALGKDEEKVINITKLYVNVTQTHYTPAKQATNGATGPVTYLHVLLRTIAETKRQRFRGDYYTHTCLSMRKQLLSGVSIYPKLHSILFPGELSPHHLPFSSTRSYPFVPPTSQKSLLRPTSGFFSSTKNWLEGWRVETTIARRTQYTRCIVKPHTHQF